MSKQNSEKDPSKESLHESHWLRFEKYMGDKGYLGTSSEHRSFILTDIDYMMSGNTFYQSAKVEYTFSFRDM